MGVPQMSIDLQNLWSTKCMVGIDEFVYAYLVFAHTENTFLIIIFWNFKTVNRMSYYYCYY